MWKAPQQRDMSDSMEAQRKAREASWSKAAPELTLKSIHVDGGHFWPRRKHENPKQEGIYLLQRKGERYIHQPIIIATRKPVNFFDKDCTFISSKTLFCYNIKFFLTCCKEDTIHFINDICCFIILEHEKKTVGFTVK